MPINGSSSDKLCFHICLSKYSSMGPLNKHGQSQIYPQFILNQYQKVGQKPAHTDTLKKCR